MPLINLSVQHGQTLEEAQNRLETAVHEMHSRFSMLISRIEWSTDRLRVRLDGRGFWVEMWVDAQAVHITADIPILGGLLGDQVATGLKQIVQRTFQKTLP